VCDANGLPLTAMLTPGQQHESTVFEDVMDRIEIPQATGRPRTRPTALGGDKGYSVRCIREWLRTHGIRVVIPARKDQRWNPRFDADAYRGRNIIERCIGWLKECRRVLTRFEKLAVHYLAIVKLAIMGRYFRKLGLSNRA